MGAASGVDKSHAHTCEIIGVSRVIRIPKPFSLGLRCREQVIAAMAGLAQQCNEGVKAQAA
jgi:hypothetical protein